MIGYGAISRYVVDKLPDINAQLVRMIVRPERVDDIQQSLGASVQVTDRWMTPAVDLDGQETSNESGDVDVIAECAGHEALRMHGVDILRAGVPLVTVSIGALADSAFYDSLKHAAQIGKSRLQLASGSIGALDALASAQHGRLQSVSYTGRKAPAGWAGSHAEAVIDLQSLTDKAVTHFDGSARDAALLYPKNANVAAAVALAGVGFDDTRVRLIADPSVTANSHEIEAVGDFGKVMFSVQGNTLPQNPRTSALAAMSVVKALSMQAAAISLI